MKKAKWFLVWLYCWLEILFMDAWDFIERQAERWW